MNHIPVFKNEIIAGLNIRPEGTYVDMTLGGGGHAREIWNQLKTGTLIAYDVDADALAAFRNSISDADSDSKKLILVNRTFSSLKDTLAELGIEHVDGIIADLGWSTDQLNSIPGLAYDTEQETDLDMRLDKSLTTKASDLVNGMYRPELLKLFEVYADITGNEAKRLVDAIIEVRKRKPIVTNVALLQIIDSTLPSAIRRGSRSGSRVLPARVFQALRIAVNDELSRLQSVLPQAWNALVAGGTLQVITFHSGEDRIVKHMLAKWVAEAKAEYLFKDGFLRPSVAELRENLRARSAKLRSIKKL